MFPFSKKKYQAPKKPKSPQSHSTPTTTTPAPAITTTTATTAAATHPSKSFPRFARRRRSSTSDSDSHPLNLPPDELRRLSQLSSAMSSPRDSRDGGVSLNSDPMETTPAPETPSAARTSTPVPATNGVNGHEANDESGETDTIHDEQNRPTPPPHRTPTTPPPPPAPRPEDAEKFKAEGNKFYKAGKYVAAIDEYGKGKWLVYWQSKTRASPANSINCSH